MDDDDLSLQENELKKINNKEGIKIEKYIIM